VPLATTPSFSLNSFSWAKGGQEEAREDCNVGGGAGSRKAIQRQANFERRTLTTCMYVCFCGFPFGNPLLLGPGHFYWGHFLLPHVRRAYLHRGERESQRPTRGFAFPPSGRMVSCWKLQDTSPSIAKSQLHIWDSVRR